MPAEEDKLARPHDLPEFDLPEYDWSDIVKKVRRIEPRLNWNYARLMLPPATPFARS